MNVVKNEPVTLAAVVTAALIATVNLIAYLADWSETATQLVNICVSAWVVVVAMVVRMAVTPNDHVALTNEQAELIRIGEGDG